MEPGTMKWSRDFECGIKIIDEQHKGLFDMIDEILNHASGNDEEEQAYFARIVDKTVDYTQVHLTTEARIMEKARLPGYEEHKKAHEAFTSTLVENILAFQTDKKIDLKEFGGYLKDWLLNHIAVSDKEYFSHFKENPELLVEINT